MYTDKNRLDFQPKKHDSIENEKVTTLSQNDKIYNVKSSTSTIFFSVKDLFTSISL